MFRKLSVFLLIGSALLLGTYSLFAQSKPIDAVGTDHLGTDLSSTSFDAQSDKALQAMKGRAEDLKIGGVAVVAYFSGDKIESWTSKMLVVGRMKDNPTATDRGSNLLGIAYAKAAEMADTLRDSGSNTRPPMTGEFGWQGGVIVHTKTGYLIVAFSGGKSADDVSVSQAGAAKLLAEIAKTK